MVLQPRFIRLKDASVYLGMDKNRFNIEVRPYLMEIHIGVQGIAFDKLDLDAFAEQYKSRNGCPPKRSNPIWDTEKCKASQKEAKTGVSIRKSSEEEFMRALELVAS